MLYFLSAHADDLNWLNIFRYLTIRGGGAMLTGLFCALILGRPVINWLNKKQIHGQPIRSDGPPTHLEKIGTPTMGGLLILLSGLGSSLLWTDLSNLYVWIVIMVITSFAIIGGVDDYIKLVTRSSNGLNAISRIIAQIGVSLLALGLIVQVTGFDLATGLAFPFIKDVLLAWGWMFLPFGVLVIVGTANAVNLTDGLDGLAIMPTVIALGCFGAISYLVGNAIFADYLHLFHIPGTGELAVLCAAFVGAGLGFLWFNTPPASVFMGDMGALSLGAGLGTVAIITKHELVLAIIGGLFVLETLSVIIQVASFKLTGRRVFRMAPIHHHFEQKGWSESTVVIRFWIIAVVLAMIGLSTLKIR